MTNNILLLLGRRDEPTDGIENDSICLASILRERGLGARVSRFAWKGRGFLGAVRELRRELGGARSEWVVLQYTPLSWGPRGFSIGALLAARATRSSGSKLIIDIHDVLPSVGPRLYDRLRERFQEMVMRTLMRQSQGIFVHVDPALVPWATEVERARMITLPTGTAIPSTSKASVREEGFNVVVFGLTDRSESADAEAIAKVMRRASKSIPGLRLSLIGRGVDRGGPGLCRRLEGDPVDVSFDGVVSQERVSEVLSSGDVLLFLRSGVSSRRSTVVAGLAHGLPIIGYRGDETGWPVTEAGLALADNGDTDAVADLLVEVARDSKKQADLAAQSLRAFEMYFSWERIADVFVESLSKADVSRGLSE